MKGCEIIGYMKRELRQPSDRMLERDPDAQPYEVAELDSFAPLGLGWRRTRGGRYVGVPPAPPYLRS